MTPTMMVKYQWLSTIDYDSLEFDPDELQVPADAMFQYRTMQEIHHVLWTRLTDSGRRRDVFVSGNTILCFDQNDLNIRVSPDLYAAFGVDATAIEERKLYLPWEAGKPPDFALEVASESTGKNDIGEKRLIYARIGIPEYWRFDGSGGDIYGEPLFGEMLAGEQYQPVDLTTEPDGILKGYSPALSLYLSWHEGRLTFYDPVTGAYLRDLGEEQEAHREAEAALRAERAAREGDQARIRQVEEELRRLRSEG